jgi:hypothetical protein
MFSSSWAGSCCAPDLTVRRRSRSWFCAASLLAAGAALARGRVRLADGDAAGAQRSLSEAVRRWNDVGAPYEAARARLSLAQAYAAGGSKHRADLERDAARAILEGITAAPPAAPPEHVEHDDALEQPVASGNVFHREGYTVHVRDLKGMRYLARLLADPNREYHVLDLVAAETGRAAQVDHNPPAKLSR